MPRRISPTLLDLPDKYFFTIGEVSHLTWVKPHVLRYWETRFKPLRPARRESGQRKYTRKDIYLIKRIRALLYDERLTLEGARRQLTQDLKKRPLARSQEPGTSKTEMLREIQSEIEDLKRELKTI